jgi:hypothetical protein
VPDSPQRPFVPHRTAKAARPIIAASEFRLYRPFLPGGESVAESMAAPPATSLERKQPEVSVPLRPIEDFLDGSAAAAPTAYGQDWTDSYDAELLRDEPEDLPPVEHFLDPLPSVQQFVPNAESEPSDPWPVESGETAPIAERVPDVSEGGWIETDWQHYDWNAVAALGESAERQASNDWATTDWDGTVQPARDPRPTAAQAIATALDAIAQRIREGELAVAGSGATPDPAKIAAAVAALLGVKR